MISKKDLEKEVLKAVRYQKDFPVRTGHLREDATSSFSHENGFDIVFDSQKAPYIDFLEYGTKPHLIPNAFGRGINVMHPGSKKHVGFIRNKSVKTAINKICELTGGILIK